MFGREHKKEAERLATENAQLRKRLGQLDGFFHSIGGPEIANQQRYRASLQQDIAELEQRHHALTTDNRNMVVYRDKHIAKLQREQERIINQANEDAKKILHEARSRGSEEAVAYKNHLDHTINALAQRANYLHHEVTRLEYVIDADTTGLYDFKNPAEDSIRLGEKLDKVREHIKVMTKNKNAVLTHDQFWFDGSEKKGQEFIKNMSVVALRSYNSEVENATKNMRAGKLDTGIRRLEKSKDHIEKMGQLIKLRINPKYHELRIEELKLAEQHLNAKKAAQEEAKEERARLREQKKIEEEIKKEKEKLDKERTHYENTIRTLKESNREEEAQEMVVKLQEIDDAINDVDKRSANTRAGYVYVISNIGSFGEGIVKIGMTRRLDPMDRVKELGGASVPFFFDVHIIHFSEDAVGVEAELHRRFENVRVNRVNMRREFFHTTPERVRDELQSIDGNILEFSAKPEAEQYYRSQELSQKAHSVSA